MRPGSERRLTLEIGKDWSGRTLPPEARSTIDVVQRGEQLTVHVEAPFAGDPAPPGPPGSLDGLWNYEVVELFLASTAVSERYLELELSPHGHFLGLLFDRPRVRSAKSSATVSAVEVKVEAGRWTGHATLEVATRALDLRGPTVGANAFRLAGHPRRYELAFSLPGSSPDFHQPEHFPRLTWA